MPDLRIEPLTEETTVTLRVDGRKISARRGESVHAALLAAGYLNLRKTRKESAPRGIFCGMGVCYDCLVTINGQTNQRACMRQVEDGMEIAFDPVQL